MVEQALVDNLLDGTYYSTNPIDLVNRNNGTNSNQSNSTVNSTSEVTNVIESNVIKYFKLTKKNCLKCKTK